MFVCNNVDELYFDVNFLFMYVSVIKWGMIRVNNDKIIVFNLLDFGNLWYIFDYFNLWGL